MSKRIRRDSRGPASAFLPALLALATGCGAPRPAAVDAGVQRHEAAFEFKGEDGKTEKVPFVFEDREKASLLSPQGGHRLTVIERTGMLSERGTLVFLTPAGRELDMKRRIAEGVAPGQDPDVVFSAKDSCALEAAWLSESRIRLKVPASCWVFKKVTEREALTITYE